MRHSALASEHVLPFILAGNSTFTIVSRKTETRYTFKVKLPKTKTMFKTWFVSLLIGTDNDNDYAYIGIIRDGKFSTTTASAMTKDAKPVIAMSWLVSRLMSKEPKPLPEACEIWHSGNCGRCGRTLTVPASIACGIGPECQKRR